jgi:hypothetical protein
VVGRRSIGVLRSIGCPSLMSRPLSEAVNHFEIRWWLGGREELFLWGIVWSRHQEALPLSRAGSVRGMKFRVSIIVWTATCNSILKRQGQQG